MALTEAKSEQMGLPEKASHEGDQKAVAPVVAQQAVEGAEQQQQQRPAKRVRREKGSATKERVSKMPPCTAGKRSSIYRGVTRHRWTGRYEAHLWDKTTWNQTQQKKGKQVYLGAYDEEEAAARAYDLAALKYWGPGTLINFPLADYTRDIEEMQNVTREEYLASLRRKSSGFSRGVSKYRGVARHHHNGRWEARIGRVFGNKYLYLGTYSTQEEAAAAYDMAAIEYRGLNAVTNFDLSRYIRWLRPGQSNSLLPENDASLSPNAPTAGDESSQLTGLTEDHQQHSPGQQEDQQQQSMWGAVKSTGDAYQSIPSLAGAQSSAQQRASSSPTALSLLVQSSMFKQMLERASATAPTECEIESSISSSYPGSSENSLGIDHQQQQHHSQLHGQQQHQDSNGWSQQQHQDTNAWSQQEHQDTNAWSQQQHQDTSTAWNQHDQQECTTTYYSAWETPTTLEQNHNVQVSPLEMHEMQDPSLENEGSVHHDHDHDHDHAYQQRLRQQLITQQVQNVVGHGHLFSDFQDQLLQQSFQNYSADLSHHRLQQQEQDPLTAAYGGHSLSSVISSLYSDQDSGASTIDDSSWAFPNLLPFSNGTITV